MSSSGRGRKVAAQPPAGPETAPGGTAPDDEQQLREEIEQTRAQLGETVEQLTAKADVKAQAKAKATELIGQVKGSTAQARAKAAERGTTARGQVAGKTVMARQKAAAASGTAKSALQARAAPVWEKTPEPVRRTVAQGASTAKQRPKPLMAAAGTLIILVLALRRWRKH